MKYLICLLIAVPLHAETQDQWRCTDESTTRSGSTWYICGVGEGMGEGEARGRALSNGLDEFTEMCQLSNDCKGRKRTVEPKRTTCSQVNQDWWKCYRLVQVSLL